MPTLNPKHTRKDFDEREGESSYTQAGASRSSYLRSRASPGCESESSSIYSRSSSVAYNTSARATPTPRPADITQSTHARASRSRTSPESESSTSSRSSSVVSTPFVICLLPHQDTPGKQCREGLFTPQEVKAHLNAPVESNGHDIVRKTKIHKAITHCEWPDCDSQPQLAFQFDHAFAHMVGFQCKECDNKPHKSITSLRLHMDAKEHLQYRRSPEEEFMVLI